MMLTDPCVKSVDYIKEIGIYQNRAMLYPPNYLKSTTISHEVIFTNSTTNDMAMDFYE